MPLEKGNDEAFKPQDPNDLAMVARSSVLKETEAAGAAEIAWMREANMEPPWLEVAPAEVCETDQ
eukprot:3930175-Prorocentrum_lima.AAC.1